MDRLHDRLSRRRHRSPLFGIVFGGLLAIIGLLILLDNLGIVVVRDVWQYWPVLVIFYGLSRAIASQAAAGLLWGGAIALVGGLLLLDSLNIRLYIFDHRVRVSFDTLWPLLLVAFGLSILFGAVDRRRHIEAMPVATEASQEGQFSVVSVFSGSRRHIETKDFRGGEIVVVFGGTRLDLSRAEMQVDEAIIEVEAVFGGVELRVPETWNVQSKGVGIFGGFDDKTIHPKPDPARKTPQLILTGASVFGGISVTN